MTRHERQLPVFGEGGQRKLSSSKVAVVGCGGLGCNVATQLALAGVGTLVLVDHDRPQETDFNRQFPHILNPEMMKCDSLAHWVSTISETACVTVPGKFDSDNSKEILEGCDLAVDCLDNNDGRLALNRACLSSKIPLVHGAVDGFFVQMAVFSPEGPCLGCFLTPGKTYGGPSIGAAVSALAGLQATEALKILTGVGKPLDGILVGDFSDGTFRILPLKPADGCLHCSVSRATD